MKRVVNNMDEISALFDADDKTDREENAARGNALENAENAAISANVPKYAPKLTAAMVQTGRAVDTATAVQSYSALWARLRDEGNENEYKLLNAIAAALNERGGIVFYHVAGRAAAAHEWGTERDENGAEIAAAYSVRVGGTDGKGENVAEVLNETFPAFNLPYTIKSIKTARQIVYRLRRIARGRTWAQIVAMERAAKNANATAAKLSDKAAKLRAKLAEVERAAELARKATETK